MSCWQEELMFSTVHPHCAHLDAIRQALSLHSFTMQSICRGMLGPVSTQTSNGAAVSGSPSVRAGKRLVRSEYCDAPVGCSSRVCRLRFAALHVWDFAPTMAKSLTVTVCSRLWVGCMRNAKRLGQCWTLTPSALPNVSVSILLELALLERKEGEVSVQLRWLISESQVDSHERLTQILCRAYRWTLPRAIHKRFVHPPPGRLSPCWCSSSHLLRDCRGLW